LPHKQDIISITGDTINQAIYFSTQDTIYRIQNGELEYISTEFGGILNYDGEGLLIFNPENNLIIRLRNSILYPSLAYRERMRRLPRLELNINETPESQELTRLLAEPRNLILSGQILQAIQAYSQLVEKDDTNSALLLEYAYALALSGLYEGALMNLDRAKLFSRFSEKSNFFAGQVFALMGFYNPAVDLLNQSVVPEWIYLKFEELYQTHKSASFFPCENDVEILFRRVNYLASVGMDFQSIALYELLLQAFPDESVFRIGYSIPLEKVGLRRLAAEELEVGILLMGNEPQLAEAKEAFNERLEQLRQPQENVTAIAEILRQFNKFSPQTMLYAGGMFSEHHTSFNARFGVFLSNSFTGSINLGISGNSSATFFNVGLSGHQRFGNVFILGLGLNSQIGKDNTAFGAVGTYGLSFINSKKNASWDIFFNTHWPFQKEAKTMYGISIGRSFYFGTR
jgi:hypothetical protein